MNNKMVSPSQPLNHEVILGRRLSMSVTMCCLAVSDHVRSYLRWSRPKISQAMLGHTHGVLHIIHGYAVVRRR